ncbi:MAG: ABC transporter substrate-binding protein [bacterium]|nr:ABC transporter substrate-binding protein [bacterium]
MSSAFRTFADRLCEVIFERSLSWAGILGGIILLVFVGLLSFPDRPLAESKDTASWEETWTKENPEPFWWTWGKKYWPDEPVKGGYYQTAAFAYIGLMNPNHWPINDFENLGHMYENLIYYDGNYKPSVYWTAESIEYLNSTTAVLKLKKGIQFHDGSDFNAASFKYQMDWIMDKKNGAWSRGWLEPVKSVEVADAYTVKFRFKRSWAGFIGMMATIPGSPISAKALKGDAAIVQANKLTAKVKTAEKKLVKLERKAEKVAAKGGKKARKAAAKAAKARKKLTHLKKQLIQAEAAAEGAVSVDKHAVGTGKYMFEKASPGNYLQMKRNPNWWFGKSIGKPGLPYPDGIRVTVIPDPSVRLANLRAKKINYMDVSKAQYNLIKRDPNIVTEFAQWPQLSALMFNTTAGPCQDIRVRRAISHAIDRKALIEGTQFGLATAAAGMYPVKHWAHNPDLKPVSYDPVLSRKLLKEAGYANGLTLTGWMPNAANDLNIAAGVQAMLAKVGVDWKYDALDNVAGDGRVKNREYDLASGSWPYIWDPDMIATARYHPGGNWNHGRSNNKKAVSLIEAGKSEMNPAKRRKVYQDFEKVIHENYEDVYLWYPWDIVAYTDNVAGYNTRFKDAGLEAFYHSHPVWLTDGGR